MREGMGLYRGKRVDNGERATGSLIKCGMTGKCFIHKDSDCVNESQQVGREGCLYLVTYEVDPETVGQYTGENPAAKEKIFEHDVVKITELSGNEFIGVVEYLECVFWVVNNKECHSLWDDCNEVIKLGNIHDNPELLEGAK